MADACVPLAQTGAVDATQRALAQAGLTVGDIDLWEVRDSFAAITLHYLQALQIPIDRFNVNGSSIALGHPLGASGARLVLTLARELKRRDGRYGLATMCIGVGQGIAMVIERMR